MSMSSDRNRGIVYPLLLAALTVLLFAPALSADDLSNERPPKQALEKGKAAYLAHCAACHQPDGKGMKGAFPPLAKSDFLKAPYTEVIDAIINGKSGPMTVNGVKYDNIMPPMSHITDEEIAAVVNFVINSWNNPGGAITTAMVAKVRGSQTDRSGGQRHPDTPEAELKYKGAPLSLIHI